MKNKETSPKKLRRPTIKSIMKSLVNPFITEKINSQMKSLEFTNYLKPISRKTNTILSAKITWLTSKKLTKESHTKTLLILKFAPRKSYIMFKRLILWSKENMRFQTKSKLMKRPRIWSLSMRLFNSKNKIQNWFNKLRI